MTREFVSRYGNPQEGELVLHLNDLEQKVQQFNDFAKSKGYSFSIRLTGGSETYVYYAQL